MLITLDSETVHVYSRSTIAPSSKAKIKVHYRNVDFFFIMVKSLRNSAYFVVVIH